MPAGNLDILTEANAAISTGNHEGFLALCTDDIEWKMIGGETISGKQALREWMAAEYREPPQFTLTDSISEGELLSVCGEITLKGTTYSYCDVWRFRGGRMAQLRAYVIET